MFQAKKKNSKKNIKLHSKAFEKNGTFFFGAKVMDRYKVVVCKTAGGKWL